MRPRRFSSAHRSGSIPVRRDDQRRLAVVDVAGRGDDARARPSAGQSSSRSSPSSAYRTARARSGSWSSVTSARRTGRRRRSIRQNTDGRPAAQPRRERRRVGGSRPDAPGGQRVARHRATAHDRRAMHDVRALEIPAERLGQRVRPVWRPRRAARGASGGRGARSCAPVAYSAQRRPRAPRPGSLSMRMARASGCLRSRAIRSARPTMQPACGPPSSLSPQNVTRSAPSASASVHRRLVAGEPALGVEQAAAHVEYERHVGLACDLRELVRSSRPP